MFSIPFKKQKVRIFIPQVGASVAIKEGFILRELRWKQENENLQNLPTTKCVRYSSRVYFISKL